MKIKIAIVILAVAALGLGIALYTTRQQAEKQRETDTSSILDFSNQVVTASGQIKDLRQDNLALTNSLAASAQQIGQLSNRLAAAQAQLETTMENARTTMAAAREQISSLNVRVSDLESQNKALDLRANELTNAIAQLNALIAETRAKLATSENNNAFLQGELQKQIAQKAELEHKFNDLDILRAQVTKIKTEMFIARRAQVMKYGPGTKKGAEILMQRTVTVAPATAPAAKSAAKSAAAPAANYDLNVEVGSDGSVRALPPLAAPTNSAAH